MSAFIQNINALTIAFLTLSAHNISQMVMWLDTKKVRFVRELLSKLKIAQLLIFWVQTHFSSHWCSNIFSRGPSHSAEETNHMYIKLQIGRPCLFIWVLPEKKSIMPHHQVNDWNLLLICFKFKPSFFSEPITFPLVGNGS